MDRPAVQEAVLMGRVMVEAASVQDSRATKPDMATRATREVIIIRGVSSSNNRVIRVIRSS